MLALWVEESFAAADVVAEVKALEPYRPLSKGGAPKIPVSAYQQAGASTGKVVTGVTTVEGAPNGKGWGVAVFDVPADAMWKAVNSDELFAGLMPISESGVIKGSPHRDGRLIFQYMPLPVVDDRWWITAMYHNTALYQQSGGKIMELYWSERMDPALLAGTKYAPMVEDAVGVAMTRGSWTVIPLSDGRTLVEYYCWTDPGGYLPAGPAAEFAGGAIDDTMSTMGDLARRLSGSKPSGYFYPDKTPVP